MKCSHAFGVSGLCSKCGKRKPGRPRAALKKTAPLRAATDPPSQPALGSSPLPPQPPSLSDARSARLASLFSPPAPPAPLAAAAGDEPPAPEPKRKRKGSVGWPWIARRCSQVVDVAAGAAINAWTDREPNDAGETEREEFEQAVEDYGQESLGKVEAPAWIVLLICLIALILSKYIGAARKPKPEPKPAPKPEPKPAAPALAADTLVPGAASVADTGETEAKISEPSLLTEGAGNVDVAEIGF